MLQLLFTGLLLGQSKNVADVEHIDHKGGVSAAVVVSEFLPLVHTQQILAPNAVGKGNGVLEETVERLRSILKKSGSSLDRIVKLNFILTADAQRDVLLKQLAAGAFGQGKPAVSFVTDKLPAGSAWAVDAVALAAPRTSWKQVEHGEGFTVLPPGTRIYVSGQAVPAKDLAEATRKTLEELRDTLKFFA